MMFYFSGEEYGDPYLEIEGTATIRDDQGLKEKYWSEQMKHYFEGPNELDYILLEIKPRLIRLMNTEEHEPQIIEL
jgi:general stress protein 26